MAHNISRNADGVYEMASGNGITPWHRLGQIEAGLMTSQEALESAHMDWIVRKAPLQVEVPVYKRTPTGLIARNADGTPKIDKMEALEVPNTFTTYREAKTGGDRRVLARNGKAVGRVYVPFQNHDAFAFLDDLVQSQEANFECAGALGEGEKVWMLMKVPHHFSLPGDDRSELYMLLENSHDGTGAIKVYPTSVRVVCQNTLTMARGEARSRGEIFNIRHTAQAANRTDEARDALGACIEWHENLNEEYQQLLTVKMTKKVMDEYFIEALSLNTHPDYIFEGKKKIINPQKGQLVSASKNRLKELNNMKKLKTNKVGEMSGTAYQALQIVTEFIDHRKREIKTGKNAGKASSKRDESAAFKDGSRIKAKAHALLVEDYLTV